MSASDIIELITSILILIGVLLTMFKVERVHVTTNSMKDQLVEATKLAAFAAGHKKAMDEVADSYGKKEV